MLPIALVALVVEDQTVLRAAPEADAPRPAILWKGDWLEVRGETRGFLSVYDHRHERPGYVAPDRVHTYALEAGEAPSIRAVAEFLRGRKGFESLGIGLLALYMRVAEPVAIDAATFELLGTFADGLARRASEGSALEELARHLEVAESYGVKIQTKDIGGRTISCHDGEAFRNSLALGGSPIVRAKAALAWTDARCDDPLWSLAEQRAQIAARAELMESIEVEGLSPILSNRVLMRRSRSWTSAIHPLARQGRWEEARMAFDRGFRALARVDKTVLEGEDEAAYEVASIALGSARSVVEPDVKGLVEVTREAGGQTCIEVEGSFRECTHALVWKSSAARSPDGAHYAIQVEPVPGWVELWIISREEQGWVTTPLVPAVSEPEIGYVELAGWSSDSRQIYVVRESVNAKGRQKVFQALDPVTKVVIQSGRTPKAVRGFERATTVWRKMTLAVR